MKKILILVCFLFLCCGCSNATTESNLFTVQSVLTEPSIVNNITTIAENQLIKSEKEKFTQTSKSSIISTISSTTNEEQFVSEFNWEFSNQYYAIDGSVLEIPPQNEWYDFDCFDKENIESGFYQGYLLLNNYGAIRYPTGIFFDSERTPELFEEGTFLGEDFSDKVTEWFVVSVDDIIGNLIVDEAKTVYCYYRAIDAFLWHTIDIVFSGETELKGVLYRYDWTENITSYHFVPFPDSLAEQKFPMFKGMYGSSGFAGGDGYIVTGDTITIDLGEDLAIENEVNDSLNEYGYCIASVKIENIHLYAWSEDFGDDYCSANLTSFEVID